MTEFIPKPGRPKGSGIDDSRELAEIAALLSRGAETTVEGAIRRVAGDHPSVVRRLHGKFARQRAQLMAAHDAAARAGWERARARRDAATATSLVLAGLAALLAFGGLGAFGGSMLLGTLLVVAGALAAAGLAVRYLRLFPPLPPDPADAPPRRPHPAWHMRLGGRSVRLEVGDLAAGLMMAAMLALIAVGWTKSVVFPLLGGAMLLSVALTTAAGKLLARGRREEQGRRAVIYGAASGVFFTVSMLCLPLAGVPFDLMRLDRHRQAAAALPLLKAADDLVALLPDDRRPEARRAILLPAFEAAFGPLTADGDGPLRAFGQAAASVLGDSADPQTMQRLSEASLLLKGRPAGR